ncbi:MAG: hypothetical protein EAX90_01580 [Candidatus Heimdallarchaeota archaeon]|nr:hypothetical protein [Candidatus Heimdallarchaeota archaeon]
MARMKTLFKNKRRGQLFLLEVFIALSVLILLMIAIYQVEFTAIPTYQDDLAEIGYNALETMNKAGELKPFIFNSQTLELANSLDEILPENIIWRLSVENSVGTTIFQVYWDRVPPVDGSIGVTDYFLYGYIDALEQYRIVHLELWRIVG